MEGLKMKGSTVINILQKYSEVNTKVRLPFRIVILLVYIPELGNSLFGI